MAKYCAHCGKQINDKAVFCKYCGEKVVFSEPTNGVSGNKHIDKDTPEDIYRVSTDTEDALAHKPVNTPAANSADKKLPKKMLAIIAVAVALIIVTAAIGAIMYFGKTNDTVPTSEAETTENTEMIESAEETSAEFDVASNLKIIEEGDVKTIETDHVIISAPRGSSWDYQLSRVKDDEGNIVNSFYIYNVDAKVDGYPGRIVEITVCDPDDNYEDWGADVIGERDGKIILATYFLAGGAECDPVNEQSEEDYDAVLREITYKLKTDSGIHDVEPKYLEQYYRTY